jgi:hypothetical protein
MSDLGATYAIGEVVPQSWTEAFSWFQSAADAQYTLAFLNLAGCYRDGDGVAKDTSKAAEWYLKAATADEPRAIEVMAQLCLTGECGISKDQREAAVWYKKGAAAGSLECLYHWGVSCATGRGVDKDYPEAAEAFRVAAEAGHPGAALDLGHCLMNGLGIAGGPKMTMAVKAYMQAAEAGVPDAMYHLGIAYVAGLGVRRQDNAGAKWLMAASRAGHPTAMNELAQLYVTGRGVDGDLDAAVMWYRKSAELGNPESAAALGSAYGAGVGPIKVDLDESAKWFRLAAKNGMPEAQDAVRDIEKEKVIRQQRQKVVDAHESAWEVFVAAAAAQASLCAADVPVPTGDTLRALLATNEPKKVRARWGPDAFSAKYGTKFSPDDLDSVLEKLTELMEYVTKQTVARMGGHNTSGGGGGGGVGNEPSALPLGRPRPGTSVGPVSPARTALPRVPEVGPSPGARGGGGAQPRSRPGTTIGVSRGLSADGGGGDRGLPSYGGIGTLGGGGRGRVRVASLVSGPGAGGSGGEGGDEGGGGAAAAAARAPAERTTTGDGGRRSSLSASMPSPRPRTTQGAQASEQTRVERSFPRPSEGGSGRRKAPFDPAAHNPKSPYVTALPKASLKLS